MSLKTAPLTAGDIIDWAVAELLDISGACEALGPVGTHYAKQLTKNRRTLFVKSFSIDDCFSRNLPTNVRVCKSKKPIRLDQRIDLIYSRLSQLRLEHDDEDDEPTNEKSFAHVIWQFIDRTPRPDLVIVEAFDAYSVFQADKSAKLKRINSSISAAITLEERLEHIATICRGIQSAATTRDINCNFFIKKRAVNLIAEWPNGATIEVNIQPTRKGKLDAPIFDCIVISAGNNSTAKRAIVPVSRVGTHISRIIIRRPSTKIFRVEPRPDKSVRSRKLCAEAGTTKKRTVARTTERTTAPARDIKPIRRDRTWASLTPRLNGGNNPFRPSPTPTPAPSKISKSIKSRPPRDSDQRDTNIIIKEISKSITTLSGSFAEVQIRCWNCRKQFQVTLVRAEGSTFCLYCEERVLLNVRWGPT